MPDTAELEVDEATLEALGIGKYDPDTNPDLGKETETEEVKADETKAEETKEEVAAEEVTEETKAEETKADETKEAEEAKAEETKADEEKATEETKAEPDTPSLEDSLAALDDEEAIPDAVKDQGEKAVDSWKDLKLAKKERDTLKVELDTLKAAGTTKEASATIAALTEELETAKKELYANDYTRSPEYQKEFIEPIDDAIAAATTAILTGNLTEEAEEEGITLESQVGRIAAALDITDDVARIKQVKAVMKNLDQTSQISVLAAANLVNPIASRLRKFQENAEENAVKDARAREIESQQQTAAQRKDELEMSGRVLAAMQKAVPGFLDDKGEVNPDFKDVADLKDTLLEEQTDSTRIAGKFAVPLLIQATKTFNAKEKKFTDTIAEKDAEIKELQDAISDTSKAKPGAGGGKKTAQEPEGEDDGEGFSAALEAVAAGETVQFPR